MDEFRQSLSTFGIQFPWAIFLAIVILPGIGFPASPLLVLAGLVWGSSSASCGLALAAVALNIVWTHGLARGPGKTVVIRLLGNRWDHLSALPRTDLAKMAWLLRITPGVPLFVQNYAIGVLGIPLRFSLLTALPVGGLFVCGFVLTGGAVFDGRTGLMVSGICLVLAAVVASRLFGKRFARSGQSPR